MFVKPKAKDMTIRDPRTMVKLPDGGANVPDSNYWRRRLLAGDVVLVEQKQPKAKAAKVEG